MGKMKHTKKPIILMVPYPAQGHVTPMLKLAAAVIIHGYQPILVIPEFIHRRIEKRVEQEEIMYVSIPDGFDENSRPDFFAIENSMENYMPVHLDRIVRKLNNDGGGGGRVVCVVVDLLASWAVKVADRCDVPVAGFWPAMLATYRLIAESSELVRNGLIYESGIPKQSGTLCSIPSESVSINTKELPWMIGTLAQRKSRFDFWKTTMNKSKRLRWVLVNSFPREHDRVSLFKNSKNPVIIPIGPLFKHTITKNKNPVSFWDEDSTCVNWLNTQKDSSVIYVSFGSLVNSIGVDKITEIALGLELSGHPFILALREDWREGLPSGYIERVLLKQLGKVVSWAPQLDILQHKAVGCYLTHCGWNSTMEAIMCKKRLLCYPIAGDQFVNCAFIVDAWKIGVRLVENFERNDVKKGVTRVLNDEEMDYRLVRLYEKNMGEEACSRIMGNLEAFLVNLNELI